MQRSPVSVSVMPRPMEGFYTSEVVKPSPLPVRTFLPTGYEPNYPYPLVVFLHRDGGNDDQVLRMAPRVSRRNYICISLRGPQPMGLRADGRLAFGWGEEGEYDDFVEEYLMRAVDITRRSYHVHSERIYIAGIEEGATQAFRIGQRMPEKLAGIISLNGTLPTPDENGPLFSSPECRQLRVLMCHGTQNENIRIDRSESDRNTLYAANMEVSYETYQTNHKLHPHMLRDMNRWIMGNVNAEIDTWLDDEE
jgi:phospholipase/carboxylesterase